MTMMFTLREAWTRLLAFFRRDALDSDFDEELRTHVELATEEHIRQGMAASEARRLALARLGGIEPSKQLHRESRGLPGLDGLIQDVRYALRALRRSPGFTLTVIVTLGIGIGVNAAVFAVTDAIAFRGFRFVDNDRILYIRGQSTSQPREFGYGVSYLDFEDWRAQATTFAGMAAHIDRFVSVSDDVGLPDRYYETQISANAFALVGQRPTLGRGFVASDGKAGAAPVVILSYRLWRNRYGENPAIVGRTVRIDGIPTTVIGVMADGFIFPGSTALWVPLIPTPDLRKQDARDLFMVFGRMADGVTIERARAEMDTIGRRVATADPSTGHTFVPLVRTFTESHTAPVQVRVYQSMWGAVGVLLLIACANLANLLLARAIGRSREIALRIALGAGRWRIIRQLLVESTMLSAIGGLLGWWIATWAVRAYVPVAYPGYSWYDFTMDGRVLGYLIAIAIGTGVLFGLAPALRLSALDVNSMLKDGGRGATGGRRGKHLSSLLVMTEMALTVMLLTVAGVMMRSLLNVYTADVGVNTANVLTAGIQLPAARYPTAETQTAFYGRLETRLAETPGVESIAIASRLPLFGSVGLPYELAGAPPIDAQHRPVISVMVVGTDYFRTLGAAVLSGRAFDALDGASGAPVAIVNEQFVREHWPGEHPIGKRLRLFTGPTPDSWLTVVGVASNIVQTPLDPHGDNRGRGAFEPLVYVPFRQGVAWTSGNRWVVLARTHVPPEALAMAFRQEVQALDPDLPINVTTLADHVAMWQWEFGIDRVVFLTFAAIALLLASSGLYALVAHAVNRRIQEIGVRMAMGATAGDILGLVLRQGLLPLCIGLAIGLAGALAVTPVLRSALVWVSPADPVTYLVASAVLVVSGVLGCWIPARRAMRVDPVIALRHE